MFYKYFYKILYALVVYLIFYRCLSNKTIFEKIDIFFREIENYKLLKFHITFNINFNNQISINMKTKNENINHFFKTTVKILTK